MRILSLLFVAALLACAIPAGNSAASAASKCLIGACAARESVFPERPGSPDQTRDGRSWNDIYNERNQERYRSGIKAKPFDPGSPNDDTKALAGAGKDMFNDNHPAARDEHVRWCLKRYRTYVVATNTYVARGGRTRFCDSPFD
jgi:hypothetical protein